jgi:hypothetical protein
MRFEKRIVEDLTYDERSTWGTCPVCKATEGNPCHLEVGFSLGVNINGERPTKGVHLGRLNNAPERRVTSFE